MSKSLLKDCPNCKNIFNLCWDRNDLLYKVGCSKCGLFTDFVGPNPNLRMEWNALVYSKLLNIDLNAAKSLVKLRG